MVRSTIWVDREAREVFITALLMAEPFEVVDPMPQFEVRALNETGFVVPVGWFGFVPAAGSGIVRMAGMDREQGLDALERLGSPDLESRTPEFEGRRLVRVDGGYIVLNFDKHRKKDHGNAERCARYRAHIKETRMSDITTHHVNMQSESESEKDNTSCILGAAPPKKIPPNRDEAVSYAKTIGLTASDVDAFFDHHDTRGWKLKGGLAMKDWRAALRTWKTIKKKMSPEKPNKGTCL